MARAFRRLVLAITFLVLTAPVSADPPEFTWLNQFAGFPESALRVAAPTANGFVGATGTRSLPFRWRAPDGTIECHMLIRYENGEWSTTGDVGTAPGGENCEFFGGSFPIKAITPFNTSICIGGDFTNLGPDDLRFFGCYTQAGQWLQINGPGNGPNNPVEALAWDGNFVYVGGSFTQVNGAESEPTSALRIVRTDGFSWDPLDSDNAGTSNGVNSTVNAILPTTSFVYAGVGSGVRRWNPGANDKWFDLGSSNTSNPVRDIELNNTLVAAASALSISWGGREAGAVSEYDGGTMEWSAVGSSSGINTRNGALAVAGGFFHATGTFTSIDPDARGIARLNSSLEWEAVPDADSLGAFPDFLDLLPLGGDICGIQQGFDNTQSFFSRGIACNDGTRWRGLAQGVAGDVYDITRFNDAIIAGGEITAAGDQVLKYIAEYRDGSWHQLGDGLEFTNASGAFPGDVRAMAVYRGELYALGLFNRADGQEAFGIARWNGQTWNSVGEGVNEPGFEMLVWRDKLIFTGRTGSNKGPVLSWDGNTIEQLPTLTRTPTALGVYQGELIAAYRPSVASLLVRLDGDSWVPLTDDSFGFSLGDINAFAVNGDDLYVGGDFEVRQGGALVSEQVAKWDGSAWSTLGDGLQTDSIFGVEDLIMAGDTAIVATGWFNNSGATPVEKLAYFDGTQWYPLGPGLHNDVVGDVGRTLFINNNTVYVGGIFDQAGNVWSENIGAFTLKTETILDSDFEGN